ncbi:MAG: nucleotide modification associated domain-containing protein [Nanoarchaeota archaeon]
MNKSVWIDFIDEIIEWQENHPLYSYNYTREEHKGNLQLYYDIIVKDEIIVDAINDFSNDKYDFEKYYKDIMMYYLMAEKLLNEGIEDIDNYIKMIVSLGLVFADQKFLITFLDIRDVYDSKNWDYNNAAENQLKYSGIESFRTTIEHKLLRLKSFYDGGDIKVTDEKIKDTVIDITNYCMIYLMWSYKDYPEF